MNLKQPLLLMAGAGRDSNNVSSKEELTLKNKFNTKGENLSHLDQTGDRVCQMGGSIRNREVRQSAGEIIIVFISTVYQMTVWKISLAFFPVIFICQREASSLIDFFFRAAAASCRQQKTSDKPTVGFQYPPETDWKQKQQMLPDEQSENPV